MQKCIFCAILLGEAPGAIAYEDETCIALMDVFPLRPGHVLVVPRSHVADIADLAPQARMHMLEIAVRLKGAITGSEISSDAFHFVLNSGRAAHQTVPHAHLHVIPRSKGDFILLLGSMARRPFGQASFKHLQDQAAMIRQFMEPPVQPSAQPQIARD